MPITGSQLEIPQLDSWLSTLPSQEDILVYIKHVPAEYRASLVKSGRGYLLDILAEKDAYFISIGWADFTQKISLARQLDYLALFSQYGLESVRQRIEQECHISFTQPPPGDISNWSNHWLTAWEDALLLITGEQYLEDSVYARTFLRFENAERIEEAKKTIEDILREDAKLFDEGRTHTQSELASQKARLMSLSFFPEDVLDEILKSARLSEKNNLLIRMLSVINVLQSLGLEAARKEPNKFLDAVWGLSVLQEERLQLSQVEGRQLVETREADWYKAFFNWIESLWRDEQILAGVAEKGIGEYLQQADRKALPEIKSLFLSFWQDSYISTAIFEPFSPELLTVQIDQAHSLSQFDRILNEVTPQVLNEVKPLAAATLKLMYNTFRKIDALVNQVQASQSQLQHASPF